MGNLRKIKDIKDEDDENLKKVEVTKGQVGETQNGVRLRNRGSCRRLPVRQCQKECFPSRQGRNCSSQGSKDRHNHLWRSFRGWSCCWSRQGPRPVISLPTKIATRSIPWHPTWF